MTALLSQLFHKNRSKCFSNEIFAICIPMVSKNMDSTKHVVKYTNKYVDTTYMHASTCNNMHVIMHMLISFDRFEFLTRFLGFVSQS